MQFPDSRPEPDDPTILHPFSRRHLLRGLGAMAFGSLVAPFESASAAAPNGSESINAFLVAYAKFLSRQRLRHITVRQVIDAHLKCRGPIKNTPPPRSLWSNIVPTIRVVDRMLGEMGVPLVEIISAYRSPSYNSRCPGACRDSLHTRNLALDVRLPLAPPGRGRGRLDACQRSFQRRHRPLRVIHPRRHTRGECRLAGVRREALLA